MTYANNNTGIVSLTERDTQIATLTAEVERLREALTGVLSWAELAAGNDDDLTQHEAWDERRTIEIARAALQPEEGEK